jgi:hypothetical protein
MLLCIKLIIIIIIELECMVIFRYGGSDLTNAVKS